jgi:hypothetical protein
MMDTPMSYEDLQAILELGGQNAQDAETMKMQQAQAQFLRQNAMRGGRTPLEVLGNTALGFAGIQKDKNSTALSRSMGDRTQQQNTAVLRGLFKRSGLGAQPTGGSAFDPDYNPGGQ